MRYEHKIVDTSTETSGDTGDRVAEMEQIANELGAEGFVWMVQAGPLMVFVREVADDDEER